MRIYKEKWRRFRKYWTGAWWLEGGFYYYAPLGVPIDMDEQATMMSRALIALWLSSLCIKPEDGKWTLLGPALDWTLMGCIFHDAVKVLTATAFKEFEVSFDMGKLATGAEDVEAFCKLQYRTMRGCRGARVSRFFATTDTKHRLAAFALVRLLSGTVFIVCFTLLFLVAPLARVVPPFCFSIVFIEEA